MAEGNMEEGAAIAQWEEFIEQKAPCHCFALRFHVAVCASSGFIFYHKAPLKF